MPTYIVNATGGQLWRYPTGTKGAIMPAGMVFESGASTNIKERLCRRVESGPYADGKNYVQASDVTAYAVPEPPTQPPSDVMYSRAGDVAIVLRDSGGNVISVHQNDAEVKWVRQT